MSDKEDKALCSINNVLETKGGASVCFHKVNPVRS